MNRFIRHYIKDLEGPWDLNATSTGRTHVILEWKGPKHAAEKDLNYTVSLMKVLCVSVWKMKMYFPIAYYT